VDALQCVLWGLARGLDELDWWLGVYDDVLHAVVPADDVGGLGFRVSIRGLEAVGEEVGEEYVREILLAVE